VGAEADSVPLGPEGKSYPPRTRITLLDAGFVFVLGCVWVLTQKHWQEVAPNDPGKG